MLRFTTLLSICLIIVALSLNAEGKGRKGRGWYQIDDKNSTCPDSTVTPEKFTENKPIKLCTEHNQKLCICFVNSDNTIGRAKCRTCKQLFRLIKDE